MKGFKAAAWLVYKSWGNAHLVCAEGWQGPVQSIHHAAPSLLSRLSLRIPFLYNLHCTHHFPVSLKMPSNYRVALLSFENLDVLNFTFQKQVVGKVVSF